jgi:UDP-N-acetylglucosamine 2-epimerase (non-hydrolysing)
MKLAPVARALAARGARHVIVHTGQHYDPEMSDAFFRDLHLPRPDHALGVGSGSHAQQTAAVMQGLEPVCLAEQPDVVLVYGDVNSTVAAALVAAKLQIKVGHVEAGLRSRDRTMPEELNRIVTDHLADLLLTPSRDAIENLAQEGIPAERVRFVGNVMIDALKVALPGARALEVPQRHRLTEREYDGDAAPAQQRGRPRHAARLLRDAVPPWRRTGRCCFPSIRAPVRKSDASSRDGDDAGVRLLDPAAVSGDARSGFGCGTRDHRFRWPAEETTWLGVPCVTVRPTTERPITCAVGTNRLAAPRRAAIQEAALSAVAERPATPPVLERWDGSTGERIAAVLCDGARFD